MYVLILVLYIYYIIIFVIFITHLVMVENPSDNLHFQDTMEDFLLIHVWDQLNAPE